MDIRREIFKAFKTRGLSIRADASKALENVLSREADKMEALDVILDEVRNRIEKRLLTTNVVDMQTITSIVAELTSNDDDINQESVELYDAYHAPRLEYDEKLKTYRVLPKGEYNLFGAAEDRANMYRERLVLTLQRMLRSGMFSTKGLGGAVPSSSMRGDNGKHELSTVASLLGSTGSRVLLGYITQPDEAQWHLEDFSGSIRLDLSHTKTMPVLFTEGSIVIVEGSLGPRGVFFVQAILSPPAEERDESLAAMGIADVFGSGWRPQHLVHMKQLEADATDAMFVILSDVQLDNPQVCEKLQEVFSGFEGSGGNVVFLLIGSFVTKPVSVPGGRQSAQNAFTQLGEMIAQCPQLAETARFVLVPGATDPGIGGILPRRPVPSSFTSELAKQVQHISFASNPCRMRFFTQDIVVFREDLLKKMQRHLVVPLSTSEDAPDITNQIVQSILDQAHLCPLPASSRPVYWQLDHAMRLFPVPHLLILADHAEQYMLEYKGCNAVNPGSFASDFSFVVYRPATSEIEFSKVPT